MTSTPVSFTTCHLLVKFHGFQVSNNLINFTICSLQCTCTHSFYFRVIQYHQFPKDTFINSLFYNYSFTVTGPYPQYIISRIPCPHARATPLTISKSNHRPPRHCVSRTSTTRFTDKNIFRSMTLNEKIHIHCLV